MPHACGEKLCCERRFPFDRGSTPRMWGKVTNIQKLEETFRFNPTHVGKRQSATTAGRLSTVQPHACGEKSVCRSEELGIFGSTPRMWGKENKSSGRFKMKRFNPTHVGKSHIQVSDAKWISVQPHACGEKRKFSNFLREGTGSTPRMWGKGLVTGTDTILFRFNPTHVGKRQSPSYF